MDVMNSMSTRYNSHCAISVGKGVTCGFHGNQTGTKKWSDPSVYLNQASGREDLVQSTMSSSPQSLKSRVKTLRGATLSSSQVW